MTRFAETTHAFEKGIESLPANEGISMIGMWEKELAGVKAPGAKGILHDLGALKTHLGKPEPDADQIGTIVSRLADATSKIAGHADGSSDKLTALGAAMADR